MSSSSSSSPSSADSAPRTADASHREVADLAHERERTSRVQYAKAYNPARSRLDPAPSERDGAASVPGGKAGADASLASPQLYDAFGSLASTASSAAGEVRDAAADAVRRGAIDVAATSRAITEAFAAVGKDFQATPAERKQLMSLLNQQQPNGKDARMRMAVAAAIVVALLLLFAQRRDRVRMA